VILLLEIAFTEGDPETYLVPMAFETGAVADELRRRSPRAVLAELSVARDGQLERGILVDAVEVPEVARALLQTIGRRRRLRGESGELVGFPTSAFRRLHEASLDEAPTQVMRAEQSNTSILYGDRLVLKIFRRLSPGLNPDLEIGRFLTERARFAHIPAVAGGLEYRSGADETATAGILQAFVPNEGDAWSFTRDQIEDFFERVRLAGRERATPPAPPADQRPEDVRSSPAADEWIGGFLEMARLLGQRTAELHRALAIDAEDAAFAPEPFTRLYQRAQYQSMRTTAQRALDLLGARLDDLPPDCHAMARRLLGAQGMVDPLLRWIVGDLLDGRRIRCHGDYHLGQVLFTGSDFVILDFEGEPARPLGERRLKRSPLRDVAGMLRSFDYANHSALLAAGERGWLTEDWSAQLDRWGRFWKAWVGAIFLGAYLRHMEGSMLLPTDPADRSALLRTFLLDKSFYELAYELNNRPDWVRIPLAGVIELLELERAPSDAGPGGSG